jgi:RNA polymerase sigma-70 factor, ECF subfamily
MSAAIGLILRGDRNAETLLLKHFSRPVTVMTLARVRDPDLAGDLTQEILVAVLQAARQGQIRDPERISAFVHGVARNIINNHMRRRRDHPEVELDDATPGMAIETLEEQRSLAERRALLGRAIQTLASAHREVLLMTLVEGLTPSQIASRTGTSSEVIRTRKTRALKHVLEAVDSLSRPAFSYHLLNRTDQR